MKMSRLVLPGRALILTTLLCSATALMKASGVGAAAPLAIVTASPLPQGTVGKAYVSSMGATGGTSPYTWAAVTALPDGLTLAPGGAFAGTPTKAGSFNFIIQVQDATANTVIAPFTMSIVSGASALVITSSATLPGGSVGTPYSQTLVATGGVTPYLWTLSNGVLPQGLSLSSSGVISGTPTGIGTSTFSVQVADSGLAKANQICYLTIAPPSAARSGVVSQVASGGGWSTSLYLVNATASAVPVVVKFWANNGTALTLPLTVTMTGVNQTSNASSVSETVAPNATLLIASESQTSTESTGWAEIISTGVITGYGAFHYTSPSGVESEGTVPFETAFSPSFILPYDGMDKFSSAIALTNLMPSQSAAVTATVWDGNGRQIATQVINLSAGGHIAFLLTDKFPSTTSNRGIIEFRAGTAINISGLDLRINPIGGFTSVPSLHRP